MITAAKERSGTDAIKITPTRHTVATFSDNGKKVLVTGLGTIEDKQELFKSFTEIKNEVEEMYGADTFASMEGIEAVHGIKVPVYNIQITGKNTGSMFDVKYSSNGFHNPPNISFNKSFDIKAISFVLDLKEGNVIWAETQAHEFTHKLLFVLLLERYGKQFLAWHQRLMSSLDELFCLYRDYDPATYTDDYLTKLLFYGEGVSQMTAEWMTDSWDPPPERYKLYVDSHNHMRKLISEFDGDCKEILSCVVKQLKPPEF